MKRKGNTGIWEWVADSFDTEGNDTVMARSEWGTVYAFRLEQWLALHEIK